MRLFTYYALHTFVNQIKKLFKTWVMIFFVACIALGVVVGLMAASISEHLENSGQENTVQEEIVQEETEDEGSAFLEEIGIRKEDLVELVTGAVILLLFVFFLMQADKNGSKIFLPADVNILFPSPMKPQSVLMFRLASQLGAALLGSVYMLLQLPNLTLNVGLDMGGALALIVVWGLTMIFGTLLQVLLYALASTYHVVKRFLRPVIYGGLLCAGGGFFLFWKAGDSNVIKAACDFFNAPVSRFLPIWGWLKALARYAVDGNVAASCIYLGVLLVGIVLLTYIIWHIRVDFYEDAMAKSEELAVLLERARSEKNTSMVLTKKKDRSEKLRRDGMRRGWGANVFFTKTLYNRFRFAHFGFLTKTMEFYLVVAASVCVLCRFAAESDSVLPLILTLAVLAFFRSLGNPLEQDTKMDYFIMIPENSWAKLFWSLLGGTVECFLDMLPALFAGALILGYNPFLALCYLPLVLSIDFYATTVGVFINLSVPVAAGKMLKQMVQILFVYFGLLPDIGILMAGLFTGHIILALMAAALINLALGGLFFGLSPVFLDS